MRRLSKSRRCSLVVLVAIGLGCGLAGAELAVQPEDRTSYLILPDGGRVYDDELVARVAELVTATTPDGLIFVFTQCSSGGMLDELATALPGEVNAALFSASRYDEPAWMAASWDPPGCLRGCGLSRPESYFAWALARLMGQGYPLGEVAEAVEELDPAAPGGPATDPAICPGESRVDPPEHPQSLFLGQGKLLRLGVTPAGAPISPSALAAVLVVGEADTIAMWNDLDRYYTLLLSCGFTPEGIMVLAGEGPGSQVELSDPEGKVFVVPDYVDAPATRTEVFSALELALGRTPPPEQFVFWCTGHGDEERRLRWAEAIPLAAGAEVRGRLDSTDDTLLDGSLYELFSFPGEAGARISVTLSSREFDAFLWLYDGERQVVASDDDSGGGTDAYISLTLPASGMYYVVVNTYSEGERGEYLLSLQVGPQGAGGKVKP